MVKSFSKTVIRCLLGNKGRFMANFLIALISVCLTAGLGSMLPVFEDSYLQNYSGENVPDLIIKNKNDSGFADDDIEKVETLFTDAECEGLMSLDLEQEEGEYDRFYAFSFEDSVLAMPDLIEGNLPKTQTEILVLEGTNNIVSYEVGETVSVDLSIFANIDATSFVSSFDQSVLQQVMAAFNSLKEKLEDPVEFTVSGIVQSPLYCAQAKEQAWVEGDEEYYVSSIFFYDEDVVDLASALDTSEAIGSLFESFLLSQTDIFVRFDGEHDYFSNGYEKEMDKNKDKAESLFGEENVSVLTMEENTSYALYENYDAKITSIALIVPIMFVALCALVNSIIVMRLIKDERGQIATYSCLGVPKKRVVSKYVMFSFASVGLGALAGYFIGCPLLPAVILDAYGAVFRMHGITFNFFTAIGLVILAAVVAVSLLITIISTLRYMRESPASLMKEKAPKPGKKIFLERIPILWNHLRFSLKSSLRNIFRQKKNFLLTSLSIIGSEILVFLGFSLHDVSDSLRDDVLFANVADSMGSISFLVIVLALAMAITIVYALATMNIQDRVRELATLKVLGYYEGECSMYTFREILIESIIAALIGLPCSIGVTAWALWYIDFGEISDVQWWTYVFSPLILLAATCLTNLILLPRIRKIDMNASLKSLD